MSMHKADVEKMNHQCWIISFWSVLKENLFQPVQANASNQLAYKLSKTNTNSCEETVNAKGFIATVRNVYLPLSESANG